MPWEAIAAEDGISSHALLTDAEAAVASGRGRVLLTFTSPENKHLTCAVIELLDRGCHAVGSRHRRRRRRQRSAGL